MINQGPVASKIPGRKSKGKKMKQEVANIQSNETSTRVAEDKYAIQGHIDDFYRLEPKTLGRGKYGVVKKGYLKSDKTDEPFAVKAIDKVPNGPTNGTDLD